MKISFKNRFAYVAKWFFGLFMFLFLFRLLYGYIEKDKAGGNDYSYDFFNSLSNIRKNYASEKIAIKQGTQVPSALANNQKFEKTASLKTKTTEFEKDEKEIKATTKSYQAIIQYEQNIGQKGNRQIHLSIGVLPEQFDNFYAAIKKIGTVKNTEVIKVDKTNEYRQLNARKNSLEKTLTSLQELKSKGGQIADFISLNEKILEIEANLQELGVELGNFDTENEFCTLRISLYEGATEKNISLIHRVRVALEWTIKYFSIIVFTCLGASLLIFMALVIVDKIKIISSIQEKLNE